MVANAQIGNEGGDKFWSWYGFDSRVEWCACFVSWCANECNYIDKGIIPKFSGCGDGITGLKKKINGMIEEILITLLVGDIIFFDWYDEMEIKTELVIM